MHVQYYVIEMFLWFYDSIYKYTFRIIWVVDRSVHVTTDNRDSLETVIIETVSKNNV